MTFTTPPEASTWHMAWCKQVDDGVAHTSARSIHELQQVKCWVHLVTEVVEDNPLHALFQVRRQSHESVVARSPLMGCLGWVEAVTLYRVKSFKKQAGGPVDHLPLGCSLTFALDPSISPRHCSVPEAASVFLCFWTSWSCISAPLSLLSAPSYSLEKKALFFSFSRALRSVVTQGVLLEKHHKCLDGTVG